MNEKPTNRASHEDGITDANSLPGENQSRAVRRRLRLGRSSSVSVEFAAAATPFTVSTRTCVGCTPCPAAATTVGGGRQRYGCGSGDALVDAERTQFAANAPSGALSVWRVFPRPPRLRLVPRRRASAGDADRRGNARRIGRENKEPRVLALLRAVAGVRVGRMGITGDVRGVAESLSGIERGVAAAVAADEGSNEKAGHAEGSRGDGCREGAGVACTVKKENGGVFVAEVALTVVVVTVVVFGAVLSQENV